MEIPTTFKISIVMEPNLINQAQGGVPWRLIDEMPQCNSSLELEREDLQNGMLRSDFQWLKRVCLAIFHFP